MVHGKYLYVSQSMCRWRVKILKHTNLLVRIVILDAENSVDTPNEPSKYAEYNVFKDGKCYKS